MNIEEMKSDWQSARNNIRPGSDPQTDAGRKTALQRLGDKYHRFTVFSLVFVVIGPSMLWSAGIRTWWIIAGYVLLLGGASVVDRWLAQNIRDIDLATMPVAEVLDRTLKCRKVHLTWAAVVGPVAIIWCALTAYAMQTDIYLVYGILTGALLGFIMGLHILLNFLRDYRRALRE